MKVLYSMLLVSALASGCVRARAQPDATVAASATAASINTESRFVMGLHACGNSTRNVVPAPGVDCTSISPSCICTVRYTIERPMPLPFSFVVK